MIYKEGKEITALYYGRQAVALVYKGTRLVWQTIRSCFGSGGWINEFGWDNNDGWKN